MRSTIVIMAFLLSLGLMVSAGAQQRKSAKEGKVKPAPEKVEPAGPPIVARVLSGDLLVLASGERVRLLGADAPVMPEKNRPGQEPWASEARRFTEGLTLGKEITIKTFGPATDEYGRRIGLVYVGSTCVDYELIKQGFAVIQTNRYLDSQNKQLFHEAQREARTENRGIWNPDNRLGQPPREFRAANSLTEGDNSKADAWKLAATPDLPPKTAPAKPGAAVKPSGTSSNNNNTQGSRTADTVASGPLQTAGQTIESLLRVQSRIGEGVKSGEFSKLLDSASQYFDAMMISPPDRSLARDLKDSLDSYRLALEAFKRKEAATAAEGEKFTKYINQALEIADASLASAVRRYQYLTKSR
jgi:micrococcal nuclease